MKTLSIVALVAALGLAASPVLAASPQAVPMCNDATSKHLNLKSDTVEQELSRGGQTISSLDMWNGCLKVIYTNGNGRSTTAFYDPDTLSLVGGADPGKQG